MTGAMTTSIAEVYPLAGKRVFVAGHRGMVGAAIARRLERENCELVTVSRNDLDLRDQEGVRQFIARQKPHAVFLAAAKVGGILANDTYPAEFLYDNLAIQNAVIAAAFGNRVEKLLFLGSSCIYPKFAPQPIPEDALLTGALEPTNEWYAIAKIAGLKLCQAYRRQYGADFISAMPTNLYGPGDNYDFETSHVIPAFIRRAFEAKSKNAENFLIWGTGKPRREFMHVDDAADAIVHLMKTYSQPGQVNVGMGTDITIKELAEVVCDVVGFQGPMKLDPSKPDGTPQKLLDVSKLFSTGWRPRYSLRNGLEHAYACFVDAIETGQARLGAQ